INDLLAQGLAHATTPGGLLVVSGILDSQAYEVRAGLQRHGLTVLAQEQTEDWVALIARGQ
ncbi:MAG: 50S ribosomal protein L11 methyltransferase, partial [Anaerolineales bacterium]